MQSRVLLRSAGLAAVLSALSATVASAQTIYTPLAPSTGYVTSGTVYSPSTGTHDGVNTFAINTSSTTSNTRALTVAADTNYNGGTLGETNGVYGNGLPSVFGGFTASSSGASVDSQLTVRVQYQNDASADFINVHVYQESSSKTLNAGLNLRLATALVFAADSVTSLAGLTSVTYVGGATSYAAGTTATHRVVVRDADSGNFYVSSANFYGAGGTIALDGSQWGLLSTSDLTSISSYADASFSSFDYIGIYSDSSVTTTGNLVGFARVNGFSLSSLSYTITPIPEPATAAALLGLGSLAAVALRRRRHAAR